MLIIYIIMFKFMNEIKNIDLKNKDLNNLAMISGLYYTPIKVEEEFNIKNTIDKDGEIINEKIFNKLYIIVDESNNKGTRKKINIPKKVKNTLKAKHKKK